MNTYNVTYYENNKGELGVLFRRGVEKEILYFKNFVEDILEIDELEELINCSFSEVEEKIAEKLGHNHINGLG